MAWGRVGTAAGIDDLLKRITENDPKLQSLTILRFRRLNDADVEALSKALQGNSSLQELTCSSHSISAAASSALGAMLQHNRALKRISIGNSSWGDQVSVHVKGCSRHPAMGAAGDLAAMAIEQAYCCCSQAAAALAQGLKHNTVLESWDLEHKVVLQSPTYSKHPSSTAHPGRSAAAAVAAAAALNHTLAPHPCLIVPTLLCPCAGPDLCSSRLHRGRTAGTPCAAAAVPL
jgi:hypothetical protein